MFKKYKSLIKEVEIILDEINNNSNFYDYKKIHCINVKRYNDYVDIDKLIENYDLETQKKIKNKFTDNYINDIYDFFIDALSNSFMGELGELESEFNFYGRSGGWFGYEVIYLYSWGEDIIDNYNRYLDENAYDIEDIKDDIDDIYNFIDEYNKYNNILIKAKEYNDNTSFKDELEYQIKEYINN